MSELKFSDGGKDYVVRSASDGTTWRARVFEEGGAESVYELEVKISILIDAKGTPIGDYINIPALVEQCRDDFIRLKKDWARIVAEEARRRASANKP